MIFLEVKTTSGHYGRPALPDNLSFKQSFPFAPPTTIRGFIESLCGKDINSFNGKFCYGLIGRPQGKGNFLKLGTYWLNEVVDGQQYNMAGMRPIIWETYIGLSYIIGVDGEFENLIKKSLEGQIERFGILSLGTSDDEVYSIKIINDPSCFWIREGHKYIMPVESPKDFTERFLKSSRFDIDKNKNNKPFWFVRA